MRRQIADPELRRKVTPDYTIGCKRILLSNHWYPRARQPQRRARHRRHRRGPRALDRRPPTAREREVDTIILGTGFHVTDMPVAHRVRGRDGRTLDDLWHGSPRAHLGTTVAGFPNLFILLGPNTGLGHSSMVYMIESQIAYVMDALRHDARARRRRRSRSRAEVQERYNASARPPARGHRLEHAAARAGTSTTPAATRRCGPTGRSRFRRRAARSTPRSTSSTRPSGSRWRHEGAADRSRQRHRRPRPRPSCAGAGAQRRRARPARGRPTSSPAT